MTSKSTARQTPANVAKHATQLSVLGDTGVVLLGLFGPAGDLNALVRLPGGRTRHVKRGEKLAMGLIVGIDDDGLMVQKNGQTRRIRMPGD